MVWKKSILFVCPDYHCSYFLRDEFRRLGWRADVFVPSSYPPLLLYRREDFYWGGISRVRPPWLRDLVDHAAKIVFFLFALFRYRYFFFYCRMNILPLQLDRIWNRLGNPDVCTYLSLAKALGKKLIYTPSGCQDEELRSYFARLDDGKVCGNCWFVRCSDELQIPTLRRHARYSDLVIGHGCFDTSYFKSVHLKYKSIDLAVWRPDIVIPDRCRLPETRNIRIMHAFIRGDRVRPDRNLKGSPFVLDAIEMLKKEHLPVELLSVHDVPSSDMRFYQAQADIVVDQLIYGCWGSTGIEAMALGKPLVCYLRPAWKAFWLKTFPDHDSLPIVEANTDNIGEVLRRLVTDREYRERKGRESRAFAERQYDPKANAKVLAETFLKL